MRPIICALFFAGMASQTLSAEFLPPAPQGTQWVLHWNDEFEGQHLDETKWNRLGDWKRRDGYWIREDAYLDGKGQLVLRTRKDGDRYTCGAINTKNKFEHGFGYYVARCKWPKEEGHWPAFWLMCNGVNQVGDEGRDGTEIDIVEVPWRSGKLTANLHWDGYGKHHKSIGTEFTIPGVMNGWHTYGLLWETNRYVFFVDEKQVWTSTNGGVSRVKQFIKLTEEIGAWGGNITKAKLPDYTFVDYVRVYTAAPVQRLPQRRSPKHDSL